MAAAGGSFRPMNKGVLRKAMRTCILSKLGGDPRPQLQGQWSLPLGIRKEKHSKRLVGQVEPLQDDKPGIIKSWEMLL